jgi:large subunit ribosomal protein L21
MYAIVEIAGQQFKVEEGQAHFVHRLEANEGDQLSFDRVLLVDNEGNVTIGKPTVEGASVTVTVLSHDKGDKVIVFKKKRRKGYKKKNGHRQSFTKISIDTITVG